MAEMSFYNNNRRLSINRTEEGIEITIGETDTIYQDEVFVINSKEDAIEFIDYLSKLKDGMRWLKEVI